MFAFTISTAILPNRHHAATHSIQTHRPTRHHLPLPTRLPPTRPHTPLRMSSDNEVDMVAIDANEEDPAIRSGQTLRDELYQMSQQRAELAAKTEATLRSLTDEVSDLMAKIREAKGMPPVADPPSTDDVEARGGGGGGGGGGGNSASNSEVDVSSNVGTATSGGASSATEDASSSSDEPYTDPLNFGYESTPGWQVLAESLQLPENEDKIEFRIECDMDGCSIVELKGDEGGRPGVRSKFIQSGSGFRVGFDPEGPKSMCAMVGTDRWAVALSHEEMRHFKRLCLALQKKMGRIGSGDEEAPLKNATVRKSADGMYNIRTARVGLDSSVEMESKLLWVQAIGQPVVGQFALRAMFLEGRQVEAFWPPECVSNIFTAVNKLRIE